MRVAVGGDCPCVRPLLGERSKSGSCGFGFRLGSVAVWEELLVKLEADQAGRSWTELFFLDEAVALAAGHRPCFLCRRKAAESFRGAWAAAIGMEEPSATAMDAVLHRERIAGRRRVHAMPAPVGELPSGTVIVVSGAGYTIAAGSAFRWTECGYEPGEAIRDADGLLTPPSTFMAVRAGYRPVLHPTLAGFAAGGAPS